METSTHILFTPSLEELVHVLKPALESNYDISSVSVGQCPDLRQAPYHLATEGLSGNERVADVGGQAHLAPRPLLDKKYSLTAIAQSMGMTASEGQLIGAGAGPFHVIGQNSELAPNLSWKDSYDNVDNKTYYALVKSSGDKPPQPTICDRSPNTECALMVNLYGSKGKPGSVLKISASGRKGQHKSFTECIRRALNDHYGDKQPISMGGVFVIKTGKAFFHVMPDFPPAADLPFKDRKQVEEWLTFHNFDAPMVCLAVFHSADPEKLDLRMEHTHAFSIGGDRSRGGHYHHDIDGEDVEYEAYLNIAKLLYRIDRPKFKG